jgi:hypothetical protein
MKGPFRTHEMFTHDGGCLVCGHTIAEGRQLSKHTANRNRHLDKHVRDGKLDAGDNRGFTWWYTDADPGAVIDLMVLLEKSLKTKRRRKSTGQAPSSGDSK